MNSIFNFLGEKQYRVFLLLISILLGLLYLFLEFKGSLATKYTAYFFVAPFFLFLLFKLKNPIILVAAPIFTLIFFENIIISRIPVTPYLRVGITLVFTLTAFASIIWHNPKRKLPGAFVVLLLLYFFFIGLSIINGNIEGMDLMPSNMASFFTTYGEFLIFFLIGYKAFEEPEQIQDLLFILIVFAALSGIGHIFSMLTGTNLEMIRGEEMVQDERSLSEGHWRYGGFWGNVNNMSAFYVMIIPASILYINKDKRVYRKVIATITIAVLLISLLMGASRGGLLFLILNSLIVLFFIKLDVKKLIYGIIGTVLLVVVMNQVLDQFFIEYVDRALEEMSRKGTESPREKIWPAALEIIKDNPTGIGLSPYNFSRLLKFYANMSWVNPHNMYLEQLTQTGWGGFLAFMTFFIWIIALNLKAVKSKPPASTELNLKFIFLIFSGFMLMSLTEPIFCNDYKINHIFGLCLGMSLFLSLKQLGRLDLKKL